MSTQWNGIVAQKSEDLDREESMILAVRDEDEEQD